MVLMCEPLANAIEELQKETILVLDINWISLKYCLLLFFKYLIGYKVIRKWVEKLS